MSLSMYAASAPVFARMLNNLSGILAKAQAHAAEKKIDPDALLQARLYPDMFTMLRQVLIACDFAKGTCARLAGVEVPKYEDNETSFAELRARIEKTIAFIDTLGPDRIDGSEARDITVQAGPNTLHFKGQPYLLNYALPNFYFHIATAYANLRHSGVEIGKKDFIGPF